MCDPLTGKTVADIGELVVYDSTGDMSAVIEGKYTHKYEVRTVKQDSEYILTMAVDEAYLQAETTVYPVYVDPTINISSSLNGSQILDAPIYNLQQCYTHGGDSRNIVGYAGAYYGAGRTLMKFPGLTSNSTFASTPANQITSLNLYMYEDSTISTYSTIRAYYYTGSAWDEDNINYDDASWNGYGSEIGSRTFGSTNTILLSFNLTSAVSAWKNSSTTADKGIMLKNDNESNWNYCKQFLSTENASDRPYIVMSYWVPVSNVNISQSSKTLNIGQTFTLTASVSPDEAVQSILWQQEFSGDSAIASVDCDGVVTANGIGTVKIIARSAFDQSKYSYCTVTVSSYIPVSQVCISQTSRTVNTNSSFNLSASVVPSNATNQNITWSSSDISIATVSSSGLVCVGSTAGPVTITATSQDGPPETQKYASCSVTVQMADYDGDGIPDNIDVDPNRVYRPPVIFLHGRTDNSFGLFGMNNSIYANPFDTDESENNEFDPEVLATSNGGLQYITRLVQNITGFVIDGTMKINGQNTTNYYFQSGVFNGEFLKGEAEYIPTYSEGGNLGAYLKSCGYDENVDLFAFNYPNEDAVIHNADKLQLYLTGLAAHARDFGNQQMKGRFFKTTADLAADHYEVDIVAHSMGALVSRYYIENLQMDTHVRKLISIDTPHWGSELANTSCSLGSFGPLDLHKLCDHDLRTDSRLFGGPFLPMLDCNALTNNCYNDYYALSPELVYKGKPISEGGREISTKYYAIAGIDYDSDVSQEDNVSFEIPNNLTTPSQVSDAIQSATGNTIGDIVTGGGYSVYIPMDVLVADDNIVGFLSQIGCKSGSGGTLEDKIPFEKIFINIDTNAGNSLSDHFHAKNAHRTVTMQKVWQYLFE